MDENENLNDLFNDDSSNSGNDWTPPYMEEGTTENTPNVDDIEPVSWDKKKTGAVLLTVIFMLIIILLTVRGCSITKKSESFSVTKNTESSTVRDISEGSSNNVEKQSTKSENSSENGEGEVVLESENLTSENEVNKDTSTGSANASNVTVVSDSTRLDTREGSLQEVSEPNLSEPLSSTGMVSGKKIYKIDNSYLYEIRLILVFGNEENVLCSYYCPRKTYDALETGTSVNVEYQVDTEGVISITSISK